MVSETAMNYIIAKAARAITLAAKNAADFAAAC